MLDLKDRYNKQEVADAKMDNNIRYAYYIISGILCFFLILLTNKILSDLGSSITFPNKINSENTLVVDSLTKVKNNLSAFENDFNFKSTQLQNASALADSNYQFQKTSFDNWLQTRKALGKPSEDKDVIARTQVLDNYFSVRQEWNKQKFKISDSLNLVRTKIGDVDEQMRKEQDVAQKKFDKAVQWYDLKVFLVRLLFILPILLLGIYFYVKYRKHKYWAIFFGFSLFSLYAFFIGLVPYLPDYGGYVHYTVGILLSIFGGYYAINKMRDYLENKKIIAQRVQEEMANRAQKVIDEQQAFEKAKEERNKKVNPEIAFQAYVDHNCPSCGKDFLFKNWLPSNLTLAEENLVVSDFCRQCGFELFKKCKQCGEPNFSNIPFCSCCGKNNID